MKLARLTDHKIHAAIAKKNKYGLSDGGGLWVLVMPSGKKSWIVIYQKEGKPRQITLGEYPVISLKQAREMLIKTKRKILALEDSDGHIVEELTFYDAAKMWHVPWAMNKTTKTELGVWHLFENHVFPKIGKVLLPDLTIDHFEDIALELQSEGLNATARYILIYCKKIFRFKPVRKLCPNNPVHSIKSGDLLNAYEIKNRTKLPQHDIPELIRRIEAFHREPARFALKLMLQFWVRTNELLGAKWAEFDFHLKIWTIPKERMKMRREHLVPLSRQAIEILQQLRHTMKFGDWLFFERGEVDKNLILHAIWDMGYKGKMTGHGFRGIASSRLNTVQVDKRVIEAQLSHLDPNRSAAAYDSSDHLEARIAMMQYWSDYIDALRFDENRGALSYSTQSPANDRPAQAADQ